MVPMQLCHHTISRRNNELGAPGTQDGPAAFGNDGGPIRRAYGGPILKANTEGHAMPRFWSLSAAGFAATAISYGPGRMGFGLFVPEFKATFAMSDTTVGLVSGLGFLGFFIGLVLAQAMLGRAGPRAPVALGLLAAATGTALVALAQTVPTLALGVFLAGSSAGFAWTPFNDAVHRKIRDTDRPTALTAISTGTSLGVALAGLAALGLIATDLSWRACWAGFAV